MKKKMRVIINGEPHDYEEGCFLPQLLASYEMKGSVAVAVNERLVRRASWQDYCVQDGDRIEIVRAVVGG